MLEGNLSHRERLHLQNANKVNKLKLFNALHERAGIKGKKDSVLNSWEPTRPQSSEQNTNHFSAAFCSFF